MASKGKERENFFRICVLVVDHIKKALVDMLIYYLYQKNMSFEDFINVHVNDINHLTERKVIYEVEVNKLIVGGKAISNITEDGLEVTLVKRLLDNLCPDLFMDDGCKTLQDFLKKNRHTIYHLFKFNERCCQCSHDYKFPVTSQLLQENQYKKMFNSSPCTNCATKSRTVCPDSSCTVTEYIKLDYNIRKKVFGHFSPIFKVLQKFTVMRNEAYGHKEAAAIPNDRYDVYKKEIEDNIMELARICGNEDQTRLALDDVQKRSCDETRLIEYMTRLSEQIQRDNELMEAIGENRQTLQEHGQIIRENNRMLREMMPPVPKVTIVQMVQEIMQIQPILQLIHQQLPKLTEQAENSKATETNLTKVVLQHGDQCKMDDEEREHYIKLLTFTFGISLDILHLYFEIRILDKEEFFFFLYRCKHVLFHALHPAVSCCECRNESIPLSQKPPRLYPAQFKLLFDIENSTLQCLHNKTGRHCLCKYSASRSVKVDSVDISLVCAIIKICCPSIHGNLRWIKDIKDTRNFLAHKANPRLTKDEYDRLFAIMENATLYFAKVVSSTLCKMIQRQISDLKKDNLSSNTVKYSLTSSYDDVCKRFESLMSNLVIQESKSIIQESKSMSRDIIDHIKKCKDELSIDINELIFEVKTHTCQQFPSQKITEESIETACATSTPQTSQPQSTQSNIENKCRVEWKLATPDTRNVSAITNTLQNVSCLLKQWFEIEFVYIG